MNTIDGKIPQRDAFGKALVALGATMPELVVFDADVSSSTKTGLFGAAYPERFFNMGVAETGMVGTAAGMATRGLRPVVSTFALFLSLKTAEQVFNCVCHNELPVVLAGGYAGLSDSYDGGSHQAVSDLAVMRSLPGMTVLAPCGAEDVEGSLRHALSLPGPCYLRLGRNPMPEPERNVFTTAIDCLRPGDAVTLVASGITVGLALEAAERLSADGLSAEVLCVRQIKPLDEAALKTSARKTGAVVVIEEHSVIGGLGGAVCETLADCAGVRTRLLGIHDAIGESGDYPGLLARHGITAEAIIATASDLNTTRSKA